MGLGRNSEGDHLGTVTAGLLQRDDPSTAQSTELSAGVVRTCDLLQIKQQESKQIQIQITSINTQIQTQWLMLKKNKVFTHSGIN